VSLLFRKSSPLVKRLKTVEKELNLIDGDIQALSECVRNPDVAQTLPRLRSARAAATGTESEPADGAKRKLRFVNGSAHLPAEQENQEHAGLQALDESLAQGQAVGAPRLPRSVASSKPEDVRRERLSDYLSGSFRSVQPLRKERSIQRNKAIAMIIIVLLALFWVVYRFFIL